MHFVLQGLLLEAGEHIVKFGRCDVIRFETVLKTLPGVLSGIVMLAYALYATWR